MRFVGRTADDEVFDKSPPTQPFSFRAGHHEVWLTAPHLPSFQFHYARCFGENILELDKIQRVAVDSKGNLERSLG